MNLNPIPNMEIASAPKPGPLTPIGKLKSSLNAYKGKIEVPEEVRELFLFVKSFNTKELNELTELKNLYKLIKQNAAASILDKVMVGEQLNKGDREMLKLLKDTLVETYKLKHGDKHVVEHRIVTAVDIRNAVFAKKTVIDVEAIKEEEPKKEVPQETTPLNLIKKILIVGYPKVGKTKFSESFKDVIHTDSYMKLDFEKQIYQILEDIKDKDEWVIEGMQGIRLFRKMLQLNQSLPEQVIYLKPKYPPEEKHKSTRKMLDTVWDDCLKLNKDTEIIYEVE